MPGPIRVLIAHENAALRQGLQALVTSQNDMEAVGEVEQGAEVVLRARETRPDVVLLDMTMPGCGLRALEQLAALQPPIRVVVLAMDENLSLLRTVLAFGSLGYVVHTQARAEMVSVIRKMVQGRSYIEVPTGGLTVDTALNPASSKHRALHEQLASLSRREREVLEAVAYGYTNREVAQWLGVSVKSVETYRYRLGDKLGFRSRAELVRFALATGLLGPGGGDPLERSQEG